MSKLAKALLIGFVSAVVLVIIIVGSIVVINKSNQFDGLNGVKKTITIENGMTTTEIARLLVNEKIVKDLSSFNFDVWLSGQGAKLKSGTFEMSTNSTNLQAIEILTNGQEINSSILIKEGVTVSQVQNELSKELKIPLKTVKEEFNEYKVTNNFIPKNIKSLEGLLFPATYDYNKETSISQLLDNMINKTVEEIKALGLNSNNFYDVINKASILEKELSPSYFPKGARVIENRLTTNATNHLLGMDTTIAYGLNKDAYDLTGADTKIKDNKYNTRIYPGLPPTPICNPGLDAIKAIMNPPKGKWVYFVTVNLDTGETKFADNIDDFEKIADEYHQWELKYKK